MVLMMRDTSRARRASGGEEDGRSRYAVMMASSCGTTAGARSPQIVWSSLRAFVPNVNGRVWPIVPLDDASEKEIAAEPAEGPAVALVHDTNACGGD
jgi:hypothetical protein